MTLSGRNMFTLFRSPAMVGRVNWRVLSALLLWGAAAWSGAVWGWRWWAQSPVQAVPLPINEPLQIDVRSVARVLGEGGDTERPKTVANASRHQLVGVVRDVSGHGVAMIATGGEPARPYRLGSALEGGYLIHSISDKEVKLALTGSDGSTAGSVPQMVLSLQR